ncbi:hypothetical protein ACNFU2_13960 [Chryseobacterium sp. PTM-20240506]|uniref:hypothetical protein n=1 Tax=unclassified Chryseobacterium TaxID=2593645 RepID=UPI00235883EA|nr:MULTISPECIES: hypothetical protein [unclassified Chryseobacterium]MDC8105990.1 hypothetical protein [Chryseobacterium sp. B21-037]MDQ1804494.1 hypothetical protein [Chryseobacterium sp. CKR4-1]
MKKILFTLFIIYGFCLNAQRTDYDWKKMDPKQRKEIINNLSPEERKDLLKKFRDNMMLDNLNVDEKDKAEFTAIYNEYIDNQKQIKSQFNPDFDPDKMSDEEAKVKLQQSFELGQKLLDNRKKYAEKMQRVVPCQKVLKLFQSEWRMRDKMNDRKPHDHNNSGTPKQNP